jgi:DNA replication protein DnaC
MALDGKFLARARDRLEKIKRQNKDEFARRQALVYSRVPEIREIDSRLRSLMAEVIRLTLKKGGDVGQAVENIKNKSLELQARRAELLVENGWPIDYLDDIYSCKKCRDTGYVAGKICDCLKELYDQEVAKSLSCLLKLGQQSFETFDLGYYDDTADPVTGISPREYMETVYRHCLEYAQTFERRTESLLLRGGTGLGKTFLSACIARVVSAKGFSVVYDTAVSALGAFEAQKFARTPEEAEEAEFRVRQMLDCDLMILDDLGTEMVTSFSSSALYTLINTRILNNRKTVINTNLSSEELRRRYSPQICSRLEGEFWNLEFVGRDIRAIKKERGLS